MDNIYKTIQQTGQGEKELLYIFKSVLKWHKSMLLNKGGRLQSPKIQKTIYYNVIKLAEFWVKVLELPAS